MVHHCNSGLKPFPSPTSMMPLPAINTLNGLATKVIMPTKKAKVVIRMDVTSGIMRIRGIFSATQIGRQLGVAVQPFDVAVTFADIARALGG